MVISVILKTDENMLPLKKLFTLQVNCFEQELDAKTSQFEASEELVKSLKVEKNRLTVDSSKSHEKMESLVEQLREMERKVAESSDSSETVVIETQTDGAVVSSALTDADTMSLDQITMMIQVNRVSEY